MSRGCFFVAVQDSGVGLSEDNMKYLFQEGVQFHANQLQGGQGSGLGLWVSKGFMELHSGTLVARSKGIGFGSEFEMMLPVFHPSSFDPNTSQIWESDHQDHDIESHVVPFESNKSTEYADQSQQLQKKAKLNQVAPSSFGLESIGVHSILVVDDATSNRKVLCRLLTNAGYVCGQAEHGQQCVEMMQASATGSQYDLILMDFEMPVLNGPLATKRLRELGYTTPVIGVTGNVLPADTDFFLSHGANFVLHKPVTMSQLQATLAKLEKIR